MTGRPGSRPQFVGVGLIFIGMEHGLSAPYPADFAVLATGPFIVNGHLRRSFQLWVKCPAYQRQLALKRTILNGPTAVASHVTRPNIDEATFPTSTGRTTSPQNISSYRPSRWGVSATTIWPTAVRNTSPYSSIGTPSNGSGHKKGEEAVVGDTKCINQAEKTPQEHAWR